MLVYILIGSLVLLSLLLCLAISVSNKQVTKTHKAMLIFFWFFSFFPLVLIPTEVVLMVKDGGSAKTSARVQMNKRRQHQEIVGGVSLDYKDHDGKIFNCIRIFFNIMSYQKYRIIFFNNSGFNLEFIK